MITHEDLNAAVEAVENREDMACAVAAAWIEYGPAVAGAAGKACKRRWSLSGVMYISDLAYLLREAYEWSRNA